MSSSPSLNRFVVVTLLGFFASNSAALALAPVITTLSHQDGGQGEQVVINGRHFTGQPLVTFNGTIASANATASTQIIATIPNGARTGPVSVTTPNGTAITTFDFTVFGKGPIIRSFSPERGGPGTQITVKGINLSGTTSVTFGGVDAASFQVTASTQLHATVPGNAKTGTIEVTTPEGTASTDEDFIFLGNQPRIESLSPQEAAPGTIVTIQGANLGNVTRVRFNGVRAAFVEIVSGSRIRAQVPQNATSGPISATNPEGTGESEFSFVVLRNINLRASTQLVPESPTISEPLKYVTQAANIGNLPATGASIFQIVPATVTIESITVSQGEAVNRGRLIKADLGTLDDSESATLEVEVVPTEQTTITNRVLLTALEPDRNTANNETTSVTSVAEGELALQLSPVSTNRLQLSWPAYPEEASVQTAPELRAVTEWSDFPATPTVINGRRVLPITPDAPQQYFRLKRLME